MSKTRLLITAVVLERRSVREVAATYGISRSWVYELVARYHAEGDTAFEPRSRRARSAPGTTPQPIVDKILELRQQLTTAGLDAGADTIGWHLQHHHQIKIARATIYRTLRRANTITPAPSKKPRSSYIRFQADQPNECWQSDITHYRLPDGTDAEIISWLDDHSRYALSITAHLRVTGPIVVTTFRQTIKQHGTPFSTLTDNGLVYTTRFAHGGKTSRNAFETELVKLRVRQKNSRPNHPTTCGKVERFQQTFKKWLRAKPQQPTSIAELQTLLNLFVEIYNHQRPHRSLPHHATPATAYTTRPKAAPADQQPDDEYRVRKDRVDSNGRVSLRHNGRLHHIGLGRTHTGTRIIMLIVDLDIRVINAATGEIIRQLTLNTNKDYQGTGAPIGGPSRPYGPHKKRNTEPQ